MSAQHTPGPWSFTDVRSQGTLVYHRIDAPGRLLGFAGTYRDGQKIATDEECEANARLIAAAPDYDRATRLALPVIEADRASFFECHTIAGDPASLSADECVVLIAYDAAITALKAAIAKAEGRS